MPGCGPCCATCRRPHERDCRTMDPGKPPRTPGPHPHLNPGPAAADLARVRDPSQSAPASPLPARRRAADTATEPVDLEQYRVRRQARAGGLINEYRLTRMKFSVPTVLS